MTLILSRASIDYVLQVTDRLVTQHDNVTQRYNPFDPLANKNIVYCSRNSIVAMAYTGIAFIEDIPTDKWIAQQLVGEPHERGTRFGPLRQQLDQGQSLTLLKERLNTASIPRKWKEQWKHEAFILCVQGWQWNKRTERPIIEWLLKEPGAVEFEIGRRPRYWFLERQTLSDGEMGIRSCLGAAPAGNISTAELEALSAKIRDASADRAESELVRTVQAIAAKNALVGPNCMSILITRRRITPDRVGLVAIKFLPATPHVAILETRTFKRRMIAAYTPWIIGPSLVAAPRLITGSTRMELPLGPYTVRIEAAEHTAGPILYAETTQSRPRVP